MKRVRIYASIPMSFMHEIKADDTFLNQLREAKSQGKLKEFLTNNPNFDFDTNAIAEYGNYRIDFCDTGAEFSEEDTRLTNVVIDDPESDDEEELL